MSKLIIVAKNLFNQQDAQAQQTFVLVNSLQKIGFDLEIITGFDEDENKPFDIPNAFIHPLKASYPSKKQDFTSKVTRKLYRNLSSAFHTSWTKASVNLAKTIIQKKGIKKILTIALPMDSHLVGISLKMEYPDLIWIAHFSDPWPESILPSPYSDWSIPVLNFIQKRVVQSVINKADKVIFTCMEQKKFFEFYYDFDENKKIATIPHIAPYIYKANVNYSENNLILAYTGSLSRERVCENLAKALAQLPENSRIKIQFYGFVHQKMKDYFSQNRVDHRVEYKGWYDKEDLILATANVNFYLLIEANMDYYPFLPSKIADYASTGKPILAITGAGSASYRLIETYKAGLACSHSVYDILKALNKIETEIFEGGNLYNEFSEDIVSEKFLGFI